MKIVALTALASFALASAGHAEEFRTDQARAGQAPGAMVIARRAPVVIGRDGQDTTYRCSTQNPNIEYRDCVNASTRDPNAKVRMG